MPSNELAQNDQTFDNADVKRLFDFFPWFWDNCFYSARSIRDEVEKESKDPLTTVVSCTMRHRENRMSVFFRKGNKTFHWNEERDYKPTNLFTTKGKIYTNNWNKPNKTSEGKTQGELKLKNQESDNLERLEEFFQGKVPRGNPSPQVKNNKGKFLKNPTKWEIVDLNRVVKDALEVKKRWTNAQKYCTHWKAWN